MSTIFFWELKCPTLHYNVAAHRSYLNSSPGSRILDLGCGTCQLSLELLDLSSEILAVEKFGDFFNVVPDHPKLKKHIADALSFKISQHFNVILLFGVVNFFTPVEEEKLYKNCYDMLEPGGVLLVKNQCGIHEEIIVDTYSTALSDHYNARYPQVDHQQSLLEGYFDVQRFDIYPPSLNLWENTHFYAFAARKKQ